MDGNWIKTPLFTLGLIGVFVWTGDVVTRASGGGGTAVLAEGVSVEVGEQVFWGRGKCHTCHSVGAQGSTIRCPNLGESADGTIIALRAVERATERSAELGRELSATDYLIESIAEPSVHVVEGYKDEMPKVYEPPISLDADQITSVILYLQTLGGAPDPAAITLPAEVREAGRGRSAEEAWEPYMDGDTLRGREFFFDTEGPAPCAKCHQVGEEGGDIGPELTFVAGTRTAKFIIESILQPSDEIASGYESVLIQTTSGRILDGVIRREDADSLWLATAEGDELALAVSEIERRRVQEVSLMPGDFADVISVKDLHDLLAFLRTLQ